MAGPYANGQELKDAVLAWSARTDLVGKLAEFVRLAEITAQRELKMRPQGLSVTGTLTAGSELLALPDDCIEPRRLWLESSPRQLVPIVSADEFVAQKDISVDQPRCSVFQALYLKFAPAPTSAIPYELLYWSGIPAITDGGTNWLLDNGPDVMLYGSLRMLARYVQDDESFARWDSAYGPVFDDLRRLEWRARYGAGYARMRPDGPTP